MSEQNNLSQLKKLAAKMTGKTADKIAGSTIADVLDIIQKNYTGGGTGGGATIQEVILNADSNYGIHGGQVAMSDGSIISIEVALIDALTLTAANGSETAKTKVTVTPALTSGNHYRYLVNGDIIPAKDEDLSSWTIWNGTDEISAQNGADLFIAECDGDNRAVKCGSCEAKAPIF